MKATTARLKADADKASLLTKVSQSPPRAAQSGDATASPVAGCQTTCGGASPDKRRSSTEWFDPGANKKKEGCASPGGTVQLRGVTSSDNNHAFEVLPRVTIHESRLSRRRRLLKKQFLLPRSQQTRLLLIWLRPRVVRRAFRKLSNLRQRPLPPSRRKISARG